MANVSLDPNAHPHTALADQHLGESTAVVDKITQNFLTNDALPYATSPSLLGIGGRLKAKPHYFVVTEIPLFECDNKICKYDDGVYQIVC